MKRKIDISNESGTGLMEVLVSITLIAVVSVGLSSSTVSSLRIAKLTEINYNASNLALSKIEGYAAVDPSTIDDGDDESESGLTSAGTTVTFSRITDVTVNADSSRTIHVVVNCENDNYPTSAEFETTLALWE